MENSHLPKKQQLSGARALQKKNAFCYWVFFAKATENGRG